MLDHGPENAAATQPHIAGVRLHVEDEKMSATSRLDQLHPFARGQTACRVPRGRERLGGFEFLAFPKLYVFRHRKTPLQADWKSRAENLTEFLEVVQKRLVRDHSTSPLFLRGTSASN